MLRSVCERTGWALGQAFVRTPDRRALECSPAWYAAAPGLESFRRATESLSFVPGVGMPGKAWELSRPVWVRDVKSDPGFERGLFAQDAGLAAGIAVPVLARDDVVAVMEFFMWEEREEDERLVALVSAVGAQLGTLFQQKQAEEALRASEEHFRAVADTAADAILSLDPGGNIAYANASAARIFGHTVSELTGRPVTDVLPGGIPAADMDEPSRLVEVAGRRAADGGAPVEFVVEAAFSRWSAGGETFTTAVLRDISARKRDQAAVHEAEERFRGAFEQAPIGMALVSIESDRAGCFLRVNRALCEIIGYSPEEMVGKAFETVVDPSDEDSSDARYVPWMLAGEVGSFEVEKRLRRADGETIVATVAVSLVPDADERPLYLIVQVQDITARTRAEAALVESRERVQAIIDNTAAVIYVKDMEGRYRLVNRTFEALFGIERDRATGSSDDELFPREVAASMRANDRRVLRRADPARGGGGDRPGGRPAHLPVREVPAAGRRRPAVRGLRDRDRHHAAKARGGVAARVRAALPPDRRHRPRRLRVDRRHRQHRCLEPAGGGDLRMERSRGARPQSRGDR